jgi:hypothetical protein
LALLAATLTTLTLAGEEKRNAAVASWGRSVVTIEVSRKQYDYYQPWSKPLRQAQKSAVLLDKHQMVTTAEDLNDRTVVRVQKGGRGRWWTAEVAWIDYHANLALLTVPEADFWTDVKPATLGKSMPTQRQFQVLRWRDGSLENRGAEFSRFNVREDRTSGVNFAVLEATSDIQAAGEGEPVVANSHLVGLVRAQEGRTCLVTPVPFIQNVVEAQRQGQYHGLGFFHFVWQRAENPATLAMLKQEGRPRGVVVINVPERPDHGEQVFKVRDIILKIDGFDIDTHGDYEDPEFGNLMLENLATRHRWAGASVPMQIWRDGHAVDITYRLPRAAFTNSLVPYAYFDHAPEYLIAGGLVFEPLTVSFLQSWGAEWRQQAPFRLNYYCNEPRTADRPGIVFLTQVLPDTYNIGYQNHSGLVVQKVNGQPVSRLAQLRDALDKPVNGFHIIEFTAGDSLQRMVLGAGEAERAATARVLERYGIPERAHLLEMDGAVPRKSAEGAKN